MLYNYQYSIIYPLNDAFTISLPFARWRIQAIQSMIVFRAGLISETQKNKSAS
jgi:hypothetical protein